MSCLVAVGLAAALVFIDWGTLLIAFMVTVGVIAPEPASLGDEELCGAWRRSFAVLEACQTPEERQAVAELRSRYLDELERRRPEVFAEWLAAGPKAAKDAAAYFLRRWRGEGRRSQ